MSLLTVKECAARMHVAASTVYALLERGLLPSLRIGTGRGTYRIDERAVEGFLAGCMTKQKAPTAPKSAAGGLFTHLDADRLAAAWKTYAPPSP